LTFGLGVTYKVPVKNKRNGQEDCIEKSSKMYFKEEDRSKGSLYHFEYQNILNSFLHRLCLFKK